MEPWSGYIVVYHIEIVVLFATLIAIGPLVKPLRLNGVTTLREQAS